MVKVTLEFENVDAAIVGLGKLVGAPVATKPPRKGRADKGQQREPYGPRTGQQADSPVEGRTGNSVGTPGAQGTKGAVTDSAKAERAATLPSTVASVVPAPAAKNGAAGAGAPASTATDPVAGAKSGDPATSTSTPAAPSAAASAAPPTLEQAQAAFKKFFETQGVTKARELFVKFGIQSRVPELKPEQYADFIAACA